MMLLNHIIRKCTAGYKFSKFREKINPFICIRRHETVNKEKKLENLI